LISEPDAKHEEKVSNRDPREEGRRRKKRYEPFDSSSSDGYTSLQREDGFTVRSRLIGDLTRTKGTVREKLEETKDASRRKKERKKEAHRTDQSVFTPHDLLPSVEQHESSRSKRRLCLSHTQTFLSHQCSLNDEKANESCLVSSEEGRKGTDVRKAHLLIPHDPRYRYTFQRSRADVSVNLRGRTNGREEGRSNTEEGEEGRGPGDGLKSGEKGSRSVGDVLDVQAVLDAAGEVLR